MLFILWIVCDVFLCLWFILGIIGWGLFNGHDSVYSVFPTSCKVKIKCIWICMIGGWFALRDGFKENPYGKYGWKIW